MKNVRTLGMIAVVVGFGLGIGAAQPGATGGVPKPSVPPADAAAAQPAVAPDAAMTELTSKTWLYEVVRHLYRWHVDEKDLDAVVKANEVIFWVHELKPKLDEGDRSLFGEVVLPQFSLVVKVKRADYTIPELNATVKNGTFRITRVDRIEGKPVRAAGSTEVRAVYTELRDELFKTRHKAVFPEGELLERLRAAVRGQVAKDLAGGAREVPKGAQVVFLAPLSPIANETWVFWETGRSLIRFASDIDLSHPAVWDHDKLTVRMFPLDQKVVVSLDEVSGSNAFMTRDEAGRGLFNCIVLGKRVELTPPEAPAGK
ncbi:MAG: hypothetical protein ACREJO_09580 [Phycisphaerales bacterium]